MNQVLDVIGYTFAAISGVCFVKAVSLACQMRRLKKYAKR